jgi:type IV pilus assembly protein PilM
VISRGVSAFTRDIANGGNYITEQIVKQIGVPYEQAEFMKCSIGDPQAASTLPQRLFQVIDAVCDTIAGEIQRSLDFFLATSGEERISRVYVTGGTSALPQIVEAVGRRARVPVELLNPLERISVSDKSVNQELLGQRSAQFSVALGLAMRRRKEKRQ